MEALIKLRNVRGNLCASRVHESKQHANDDNDHDDDNHDHNPNHGAACTINISNS